jgi:hypothetical protein
MTTLVSGESNYLWTEKRGQNHRVEQFEHTPGVWALIGFIDTNGRLNCVEDGKESGDGRK